MSEAAGGRRRRMSESEYCRQNRGRRNWLELNHDGTTDTAEETIKSLEPRINADDRREFFLALSAFTSVASVEGCRSAGQCATQHR